MRRTGVFFQVKERRSIMIMRRAIILAIFIVVALWSHAPFSAPLSEESITEAQSVKIYTEDFAPFNYMSDGGLTGAGAEMVRAMARRLGHNGNFEVLPWKRALKIVKGVPGAAVFSMVRTAEREDEFKWVGPILITHGWLYKMTGSKLDIKELDDARKVAAIGVQAGGAAEQFLRAQGFKNLAALMEYQRKKYNFDLSDVEPAVNLGTYALYLAFSHQTPDFVIYPWKQALEEMHRDGTFAAIGSKYGMTVPDDGDDIAPAPEFEPMTR